MLVDVPEYGLCLRAEGPGLAVCVPALPAGADNNTWACVWILLFKRKILERARELECGGTASTAHTHLQVSWQVQWEAGCGVVGTRYSSQVGVN